MCTSPDVVRVVKSKETKWLAPVACMGEMRNADNILVKKCIGKTSARRPTKLDTSFSVSGILRWNLWKLSNKF